MDLTAICVLLSDRKSFLAPLDLDPNNHPKQAVFKSAEIILLRF